MGKIMTSECTNDTPEIIWGAKAIAREIGRSPRQTFNMLEQGLIPATRVGRLWCSEKTVLRRAIVDAMTVQTNPKTGAR
jgi:hypothetical protein